jgi:hypothetical protein
MGAAIVQGPVVEERRIVPAAELVPETLAARIVRAGPVTERGREILAAPIDQAAEPGLETSVAQVDPAVGPEPQLDLPAVAAEIALEIAAFHQAADSVRATTHLVAEEDLAEVPRDPLALAEEAVWAAVDLAVAAAVAASEEAGAAVVVVAVAVEAEVVVNNQCPRKDK